MLWAGQAWGGVIVAQLLSERATAIIPLDLFRRGLQALESDAKPLTLVGLTAAQVLGGAALGALYAWVARPSMRARIAGASALAVVIWLALSFVAAPLGNAGIFARDVERVGATQASFILAALLYGVLSAALVPPTVAAVANPARRRLLGQAVVGSIALLSAIYIGRYTSDLRRKNARIGTTLGEGEATAQQPAVTAGTANGGTAPNETFAFAGMPPIVTPTSQFYIVSKNFVDPKVDASGWTLDISGLVSNPLSLSYTDLTQRASQEFTATLECISNPTGGDYISTGVWRGFPLAVLLEEAGLQDGVYDIELRAADGYLESIPLAKALDPRVMVAHTLNGEPLPDAHGKPARLIVPDIFGMKNVKWLTSIAAVDSDTMGYWQDRGWSDDATVVTMSRIDTVKNDAKLPVGQPVMLGGIAFAGARGVSRVEVSLDGGKTWDDATLNDRPAPLAWRLWKYQFTPAAIGTLTLTVRATDGNGVQQVSAKRETLPDGATGYHTKKMNIVVA